MTAIDVPITPEAPPVIDYQGYVPAPPVFTPPSSPDDKLTANWRAYEWFPLPGAPIQFKHQQDYSSWDDVWNWLSNKDPNADIDRYNKQAAPFVQIEIWTKQLVADAIAVMGGQMNKLLEFQTDTLDALNERDALNYMFRSNWDWWVGRELDNLAKYGYSSAAQLAQVAGSNDATLQRNIANAQLNAIRQSFQLAVQEIYWPLDTKINHVNARIDNLPQQSPGISKATVGTMIGTALAPVLAQLQQLQAQLKPIQTEIDTCVEPMCAVLGPNTPGGNIMKAIDWAKFLAFLAELALLDLDTAEDVALTAARIGETPARDFVQLWFGL